MHSCGSSPRWLCSKTDLTFKSNDLYVFSRHGNCQHMVHQQFLEVYCYYVTTRQRVSGGATHLHLAGTMWQTIKWMTNLLNNRSQQCAYWWTHSDGQMCKFAAYDIWLWFILRHSTAYCGDVLEYSEVCARWVPHELADTIKQQEWWSFSVPCNPVQQREATVCEKL